MGNTVILSQAEIGKAAKLVDVEAFHKPGTKFWYSVAKYSVQPLTPTPVYLFAVYDEQGHGSSNFCTEQEVNDAKTKLPEYTDPFTEDELREHSKLYGKK